MYAGGFGMIAPDAVDPQNPLPDRYAEVDRDNIVAGSVIGVQNQTLGESLPVTNTPMTMHYKSDRVFGRREAYCLDIPLTGSTVPEGMSEVTLEIEILGRKYEYEFEPQPDLTYHFEWDGRDAYGRRVQGQHNILTTISYAFPAHYTLPADFKRCFGTPSGQIIQQYIPARRQILRTQLWEGKIGAFDIVSLGIGGWSLSLHHGYDCVGRIVYKGDGQISSARVMDNVVNTIAGVPSGSLTQKCDPADDIDNLPATEARIGTPKDLTFTSDGLIVFSDKLGTVRTIDSAGIIHTIAGKYGGCGTGLPDTATGIMANCGYFSYTTNVVEGPDKCLYVSDLLHNVVYKISRYGERTRYAGIHYIESSGFGWNGLYGGDGGPALDAYFARPSPIAFGKDGSLYIGEERNSYRIRRVSPDGIVTTVAGTGVQGYSGDGGPAVNAQINEVRGMTVGPDGSIYFGDWSNCRVRRITPDGIIRTIAGNGIAGNTGDGGPAIYARIGPIESITAAKDGTVFFDSYTKVRGVSTDGYIKTIVGGGSTYWMENGPATSTALGNYPQVEMGPDGNLYVSDDVFPYSTLGPRIFKLTPPLSSITLSEILVASEDGSEQYVFTYSGRHLRTLDALTGVTKYTFDYDSCYRLITITDIDSLVTSIERDTSGKATAIISPYGVRTELTLDSLGYLLNASNPLNEAKQFTYTDGGLMTSMTDARNHTYQYEYDTLGYLTKDLDPVGGYTELTRAYDSAGYTITATTAMGKVTTYRAEKSPDGTRRFINIDPNGLVTMTVDSTDGSSYTITPEGMNRPAQEKPDPRFGMQSPLANATASTPGGIQSNVNQFRTITQMTGLEVTGLQDSILVNGKPFKVDYDGNAKVLTKTSPEGRKTYSFFDEKGRIVKDSIPGLLATTYTFDSKGRKIEENWGPEGAGGRKTTYEYDTLGRQSKVTDPYNHNTWFFYDLADRLVRTVLPDSSEVTFAHDSSGNMISITPPGKPAHTFEYSDVDLETLYTPPDVGDSTRSTGRTYTLDKEAWKVLRPDSLNITLEYGGQGSLAGVPKKIYFDRGMLTNLCDTLKGQQIGVVSAEDDTLKFIYDGTLVKKVSWTGTNGANSVKGDLAFTYNNDQLVTTETVIPETGSADSVNLQYDNDGLLTSIGLMKLRYGTSNNLLLSDTVGNIVTNYSYDTYGALASKEVTYDATLLFKVEYVRDSLSRITEKKENVQGDTVLYNYTYDAVGRLSEVFRNDTLIASYEYDQNGNRLSKITPADTLNGIYDAQDRLLNYSSTRYFYTTNGDLAMRVDTVAGDTTRYSYDALGSLRNVQLPDGTFIEYLIDGSGKRVGRKINGAITQKWLYSSDLRIIAELDSSNQIISRFVYATSENVPEYFIKSDTIYRVVTDHLGSVRQVVNIQTGTITQQIEYDEYGDILFDSNAGFTPFGFVGGLYDTQTELIRFGLRDYEAEIGRWTVKDKLLFGSKSTNHYSYASEDPIGKVDVSGTVNLKAATSATIMIGIAVMEMVSSMIALVEGSPNNYVGIAANIGSFSVAMASAGISFNKLINALQDKEFNVRENVTEEILDMVGVKDRDIDLFSAFISGASAMAVARATGHYGLRTALQMALLYNVISSSVKYAVHFY